MGGNFRVKWVATLPCNRWQLCRVIRRHRWEPHIHAPGTVLNNQFKGPNAWDKYLSTLESASPTIEAVAVTDYYVTDTYEEVVRFKDSGRLPAVKLIFPNIELRLDAASSKGGFINLHLLVNPQNSQDLSQLQRLLSRLRFEAFDDRFDCTRDDLIRLGKIADSSITDDKAALQLGATQFKVNFDQLRKVMRGNKWVEENILVAVAAGTNDGTSGLQNPADKTLREEIEKFAHVLFSSRAKDREYWLGQGLKSEEDIRERYNGLKPCLHGSDAHNFDDIAKPFGDRFSWIKGGLEFDSLRQACIDPAGRAWVGPEPPSSATPSQVISEIRITNAPWAATADIPLNPRLVAIIGARGSGKTALADMIAAGCDAISEEVWDETNMMSPSFLARAKPLIDEAKVELKWGSGDIVRRSLDGSDANDPLSYPRARYLSQQFVEELCSSSGMTDGLIHEIERVIFEAHSENDRSGTIDFSEMLEQHASLYRLTQQRESEAVTQISERISTELEKDKLIDFYESQIKQKQKLIGDYIADRTKLVAKGNDERVRRHEELTKAVDKVRTKLRKFGNQKQSFLGLQDEVTDHRQNQAPEALRQMQSRHPNSGMNIEQWEQFLLDYKGKVDDSLAGYIRWVNGKIAELKGLPPETTDEDAPYIPDDVDLESIPLAVLEAEMQRVGKLVSADEEIQRKYAAVSDRITTENAALAKLTENLEDCKGSKDRIEQLQIDRDKAYGRAFEALIAEQEVLEMLYGPLMARLEASSGTLNKLSFSVSRVADVHKWATEAEENLLDLRKQGPFRGKGKLIEKAKEVLGPAWETGTATDVINAMSNFQQRYEEELLEHSPVATKEQPEFRKWLKKFSHWLYSTSHININYGIEYGGVDIRKLSPGTRGIVLLLLYLALDDVDDRPLIIDQPEENLDPQSVFDELVGLFISAKQNRQVIMVTHNANLVVNTDADQIIVAKAGPNPHGALPPITYSSGGLESATIRKEVCDILEGGEKAFRERARKLRVNLMR